MFSTIDPHIGVASFVKKANDVCIIKSKCSKLVSTRRPIVLSLPFRKTSLGKTMCSLSGLISPACSESKASLPEGRKSVCKLHFDQV